MGTVSLDGQQDAETLLYRRYQPTTRHQLGAAPIVSDEPERRFSEAIYGGAFLPAFGHFILETLARLWAAPTNPRLPILFSWPEGRNPPSLSVWQRDILGLLGIRNPVHLLTQPVLVDRLLVPAPGYEIQYRFARRHARFLAQVRWQPEHGRKIWVSRSGVEPPSSPGRDVLERELARAGWSILHPERLSFSDQMDAYAKAERIAGEQGSALHALIFLKDCEGLRLDMFARDPSLNMREMNANQQTICGRKGIALITHIMNGETTLAREGPRVTKRFDHPEAYLTALDDAP